MSGYRSIIFSAIALGSTLISGVSSAIETEGYFCGNCIDTESARQQAFQYAAPLVCNSGEVLIDPSTELVCRAEQRRVVLGNFLTRQLFAFRVSRSNSAPWAAEAIQVSLSPDEVAGYTKIFEFRADWEASVLSSPSLIPEASVNSDPSDCPTGTALEWAVKTGGRSRLKDEATARLSEDTEEHSESSPWYIPSIGVGARHKGVNFDFKWPKEDKSDEPVDEYRFYFAPRNELGLLDVLVFNILSSQVDKAVGQAITELEFSESKSRAAGHNLEDLLAGDVVITDECALETLDQRESLGGSDLRVGGVPLNADGSVAGGGSGGAGGGTPTRMCVFDFFVNGRYQYSFTAPCDSFKEKEEIKP